MSYVKNNLMSNENIVYTAKIHWFVFVPGLLLMLIAFANTGQEVDNPLTPFFWFFGVALFLKAMLEKSSTEMAVTNKRIIAKTGIIKRDTVELNHNKIESFNVNQGVFGRIFGYGTITINGTGGGKSPIKNIDAPLVFRKNAMEAIDQNGN